MPHLRNRHLFGLDVLLLSVLPFALYALRFESLGLDSANLAQLVMVSGPLRDPRIGVDVKGAARETADIGVAVATGGLSLVGKRLLSRPDETDVCRQAAAGAPAEGAASATPPGKSQRSR